MELLSTTSGVFWANKTFSNIRCYPGHDCSELGPCSCGIKTFPDGVKRCGILTKEGECTWGVVTARVTNLLSYSYLLVLWSQAGSFFAGRSAITWWKALFVIIWLLYNNISWRLAPVDRQLQNQQRINYTYERNYTKPLARRPPKRLEYRTTWKEQHPQCSLRHTRQNQDQRGHYRITLCDDSIHSTTKKTLIHHQIKLDDSQEADILSQFLPAIQFIEGELEKGRGVLVHCLAGISTFSTSIQPSFLTEASSKAGVQPS